MRLPPYLQRYADRIDAMSLRERVLVFLAVAVVLVAIAESAFFEPILRRQKLGAQKIQQQQDEMRAMQLQLQAFAQARASDAASAKRQRLEKRKLELAALDGDIVARQSELVTPERMAKMVSAMIRRNPEVELVSLKSLPATGLIQAPKGAADSSPSGLYRHGVELVVSGRYMSMLTYVDQLERLPEKMFWGSMELQGTYPTVKLKIVLFTLSQDKTWLLI
ncbi:MAG: type II secretion system protein GspM [Burkholderiales bacterium]